MTVDDSEILKVINWVERAQSYFVFLKKRFYDVDSEATWLGWCLEDRGIMDFTYYDPPRNRPVITSMEAVFDFKICKSLWEFYMFGSRKMSLYFRSPKTKFVSGIGFYGYREMLQAIYEFRKAAESFPEFKDVFFNCTPLCELANGDLVFLEKRDDSELQPVTLFLHETQQLIRLAPDFWSFLVESEKSHYYPIAGWTDFLNPETGYFSADMIDPAIFEPIADFRPIQITNKVPRRKR